ncbi:MAG: DNA repair protein RadA [Clostridia bacterium]
MAKSKSVFVCNDCGYESAGWLGKCPACNAWNTFFEQKISASKNESSGSQKRGSQGRSAIVEFGKIDSSHDIRVASGINELDRVLGGGIVPGSLVLVGGEPGIGKSTLIMQLCGHMADADDILYVSGEESAVQVKHRAIRLEALTESRSSKMLMLAETCFEVAEEAILSIRPAAVIIDSIQTMFSESLESASGSVSQVREVTARLMRIAKSEGITVFLVGHVTKEGAIAGPRVLEHMVDTVLYFEGDRYLNYRVLRAVKNRFGATNEIGVFEMTEKGLIQVDNPSLLFLGERPQGVPGTVVVSSMEGSRSLLVEVQALVTNSGLAIPRRTARGVDYNRMNMLLAVLDKMGGMSVGAFDVYINVVGGLALDEPACDLGVVMAVASSFKNKAVDSKTVFIGEVGLTGEVRAVGQIEKRIAEAARLGFETCVIPKGNAKALKSVVPENLKMKSISNISEMLKLL